LSQIRYVPAAFSIPFGPWVPSATAFFNVFLMASLNGAGSFAKIGYFMVGTTVVRVMGCALLRPI
jgi:C-terminus of AA_permease